MEIFSIRYFILRLRTTCHRYMNTELKLYSVCRRKRNNHASDKNHKTFDNLLNQDFTAEEPNKKWCVDFTYLFLQNGAKRYNCTIIDLFDRSVVASITDKEITAELAKMALSKAIKDNPKVLKTGVILHSDQGSQFTSNDFIETCKGYGIKQSMSRAGCPYDNAPMERYFNTLKNELIYHYTYSTDDKVDQPVSLYAATKKSDELLAYAYSNLYDIKVTGLRFFTVYGPYGRPDMAYFSFTKNIIDDKEIKVFNNGDMYRDFTYIDDIVEGIIELLDKVPLKDENGVSYKIYNIGNNHPVKISKFIEILEKEIGKEAKKVYLPMQPGDVYQTYADITDLTKETGFVPKTSLEEGLNKFVNWYKEFYGGDR